jgi:type VI secretion system protein ImpA
MSLSVLAKPIEAAPVDDGGYFDRHLGVPFDRLLAPLDGELPTGLPVRGTMVFRLVEQARRNDDASLPMGSWAIELRRANWPKVSSLIVNAFRDTAKDLQLASWLLEAEIHQRGFAAIAPCIALMQGLCSHWWSELHPRGEDGDFESRANIVRWVNEKLIPTLSLAPLVADDMRVATWSDWELAHHYERIKAAKGELPDEASGAMTLDALHVLLGSVRLDALRERYDQLVAAREAVAAFDRCLRGQFAAHEAPSLGRLDELLAYAQAPLRSEVTRRGEPLRRPVAVVATAEAEADIVEEAEDIDDARADGERLPAQVDRDSAYRTLADIADFLAAIEPHSPVPYLIRRAVEWGAMNTAELYHEVFVRSNGQISVFELLGLGQIEAVDE